MPTPMYLLNHHHHSHYHQHIITFPHQGPPRQESEGDIGSLSLSDGDIGSFSLSHIEALQDKSQRVILVHFHFQRVILVHFHFPASRPSKTRVRGWYWFCSTRTCSPTRRGWGRSSRDTFPWTHILSAKIPGSGRGSGLCNCPFEIRNDVSVNFDIGFIIKDQMIRFALPHRGGFRSGKKRQKRENVEMEIIHS